jgi:hypothetical protein
VTETNQQGGPAVATDEEYKRVLFKAKHSGPGSLTKQEADIFMRMTRETSSRGNEARKILNG